MAKLGVCRDSRCVASRKTCGRNELTLALPLRLLVALVENRVPPGHLTPLQEGNEALVMQSFGRGNTGELEQRRRDVDVGDHVPGVGAARRQPRA